MCSPHFYVVAHILVWFIAMAIVVLTWTELMLFPATPFWNRLSALFCSCQHFFFPLPTELLTRLNKIFLHATDQVIEKEGCSPHSSFQRCRILTCIPWLVEFLSLQMRVWKLFKCRKAACWLICPVSPQSCVSQNPYSTSLWRTTQTLCLFSPNLPQETKRTTVDLCILEMSLWARLRFF